MHSYLISFLLLAFCINFCFSKKYYNFTLFRIIPTERKQMDFIRRLNNVYDGMFWRHPEVLFKPVDFMINSKDKPKFLAEANKIKINLTTMIEDVQRAFDKQTIKNYTTRKMDSFDWNNFFRLGDMYQWLRDIAMAHPREMELQSIGATHENRDIMAVKIVLKGCKMRSRVIIEGGIHAREWIAPAVVTYLIQQILNSPFSHDNNLRTVAITYEWYIVPVLNPDGYEYSHTEDRLWRKNRRDGYGVDLNRNFGYAFGTTGVSSHKEGSTYCGPRAFSEIESIAMANFIKSKSSDLEYYFAFHSYGQAMIIPYGNSNKHSENFYDMINMCEQAKVKIAAKFRTAYVAGTAYETIGYHSSGLSCDWVKNQFKIPYVLTFELRDTGYDGFALPPKLILPTCQETLDGVVSLLIPRTPSYKGLRETLETSSQSFNILDKSLVVINLFFISTYYSLF